MSALADVWTQASIGPMRRASPRSPRVSGPETPPKAPAIEAAAMIQAIAARSDREAFTALFSHFAPRVKAYLLRGGSSPAAAEELAQETLLAVWRKAAQFDPARAGASTWIFTIARNLRIDAIRRDRPAPVAEDPTDAAPPAQADALVSAAERDDRVRGALRSLSPEQAEIVQLSYFSDETQSVIAARLGLPLGTVKSRLRLALVRLRGLLEDLQ